MPDEDISTPPTTDAPPKTEDTKDKPADKADKADKPTNMPMNPPPIKSGSNGDGGDGSDEDDFDFEEEDTEEASDAKEDDGDGDEEEEGEDDDEDGDAFDDDGYPIRPPRTCDGMTTQLVICVGPPPPPPRNARKGRKVRDEDAEDCCGSGSKNPANANASGKKKRPQRSESVERFLNKLSDEEFGYWKKMKADEKEAILKECKLVEQSTPFDMKTPLRFRILESSMSQSCKRNLLSKIDNFNMMREGSGEYTKTRSWLNSVTRLPLGIYKDLPVKPWDKHDVIAAFIQGVRKTLDKTVYGHIEVKDQIMRIIAQWVSNPLAKGHCIGLHGPPGVGKCHAKDAPILMYDGSVKMVQDIVLGDQIMGDDSTPRNVLALGRGKDDLYDVVPDKGDTYRVNSEHILCLKDDASKEIFEISVNYFNVLPPDVRAILEGYRVKVDFDKQDVPIDPYEMGVNADSYRIPRCFLCNDRETRMLVLAGLIDSRGTYDKDKDAYIITACISMVPDILYLARSLGLAAYKEGYDNIVAVYGYGVHEIPVKNDIRGMQLYTDDAYNVLSTPITVTPAGHGDYYGFMIDGNQRYVMGDFTVTHNTQIVKNGISHALNLPFSFVALGGASDGSFLEGHSITYEGSTYGKIAEILMKAGAMNPIIFFDELDKVSATSRGQEVIGILTHLTDSTQNDRFNDKYFSDFDLDLSKALTIFSYNDETLINPILKDRMTIIHVPGYKREERKLIARDFLVPDILAQHNLKIEDILISDAVLNIVVDATSEEKGVRNLKRALESIFSGLNMNRYIPDIKTGTTITLPVTVTDQHLKTYMKITSPEDLSHINHMYL